MELIKQGEKEYFKNKTILFHLEFTDVCNQHCSYCVEGNWDLNKPKCSCSKEEDILWAIDKIFEAYDENVGLGFIHVGGEPTLQPAFKTVVEKIKKRKNAFQVLTTNFTQSVEYYRELDIPLVTSLHFDSQEPKAWLEKTIQLCDLIANTRIMAHPQKMNLVKESYELFLEASKKYPLSFAVEEIFPCGDYTPNYAQQDLELIRSIKPVDCFYPQSLQEKLGVMNNLFYRWTWTFKDTNGDLIDKNEGPKNFKKFFCEQNMMLIRADGKLSLGWACRDSKINMYKVEKFPTNVVKTVVCKEKECPMGFASMFPKYKYMSDAPNYVKKSDLIWLKLKNLFKKKK
jgi:organic radical activating enzyme